MIKAIRLRHYRSYDDKNFKFNEGVNIIVGPNGSGKTNLLEAVLMACLYGSYRANDTDVIQHQTDWARIDAETEQEKRVLKLKRVQENKVQRIVEINGQPIHRLTQKRRLPVTLFEPSELQLFGNGPDKRRDYLDNIIEVLHPEYAAISQQYKRSLAQRNRLLKQQPTGVRDNLFVWNIRLSELGGKIVSYRRELVEVLAKSLPKAYQTIAADQTDVFMEYQSSVSGANYSTALLHKLEHHTELDLARGFTVYGPHRDDLQILIGGYKLQTNASRGEIRSLMLALKIIEIDLIEEVFGSKTILLLDDVFSELDISRRRALTEMIAHRQTFITTTDAEVITQHYKKGTIIKLS